MGNKRKTKNEIIKYFLVVLCITTTLMLVKKSKILETLTNYSPLRNLIERNKRNYICDKAGSRLTDKYKTDFQEKDFKAETLTKAQQSIINFAKDSKYSNIKPYVKHCGIFIFFLCLAIIFLICWISYCTCACCSCCLFSRAYPSRCCSGILFFTTCVCLFLVILFSIIVLALITQFSKRLNGSGCSAHYFLDHVKSGLSPDYSKRNLEWQGIKGLKYKLEYTEAEANKIRGNSNILNNDISREKENDYPQSCKQSLITLKSDVQSTDNLISDTFNEISSNGYNSLDSIDEGFEKADNNIGDRLYNVMHDHVNKYAIKLCKTIFYIILFSSILGLIVLFLYFCCGLTIMGKIYTIFWNLFMILMILAIILSAIFGIIGYLFTDFAQVSQYVLSKENFESQDPLIFKTDNEYVKKLVDTCTNGNGNFTNVIDGGIEVNKNLQIWEQNKDEYSKEKEEINCGIFHESKTKKLKDYYSTLIDITDKSLNLSYSLTNVTCSFARNDKNILLNEVDDAGNHGVTLCVLSFLTGIFLGFSVLAGILLVHKFKLGYKEKISNIKIHNDSSANIGNDNNATQPNMFPNNNQMVK